MGDFVGVKMIFQRVYCKNIMGMAIPMILAQFVNVLYNIADRIFIARCRKMPCLNRYIEFVCLLFQ